MTIEIDKNFETILLCAVRYAIGRKTYIPSLVIDYITPLLPYLSENTLRLIANEITEHGAYEGGLGDEKIDKPYWLDFLRKIRLEMGGRRMTELKKCPFCGGEAEVKSYDPFDGYQGNCKLWLIQCAGCGVLLKRRMENEAMADWNRRVE